MTPQPDRDDKTLGISRRALLAGAGLGVAAASLGWIPGERIPAARAQTATPVNFPSASTLPAGVPELGRHDRHRRRLDLRARPRPTWSRWPTGRTPTGTGCGPRACATTGRRSCCPRAAPGRIVLVDTDPGPDLGIDQRGVAGHGHGAGRRHDGHADQRAGRPPATGSARSRRPATSRSAAHWPSTRTAARSRRPARRRCPGRPTARCRNLILSLTAVGLELGRPVRAEDVPAHGPGHPRRSWPTWAARSSPRSPCRSARQPEPACQSWVDISAADLFAPPASAGSSSFASYVDGAGRVEAIWFPFTDTPWLKVWSLSPPKPLRSEG